MDKIMLNKKYLAKVGKDILDYSKRRREIIKKSGDILYSSKKAIFAMQRDDIKLAEEKLINIKKQLNVLIKKYGRDKKILQEGSYKAALEEFIEATLFFQFLQGKTIGQISIVVDPDIYISGLCDVPGEMYRYAIKSATNGNFAMVQKCFSATEEIIGVMLEMDLTGYNRSKFDQAKKALHKLQNVVYEITLRK